MKRVLKLQTPFLISEEASFEIAYRYRWCIH